MAFSLRNVINLDIKLGTVSASAPSRDVLGLFIVFQKTFDEICANTLVINYREALRPITDDIKENLLDDSRNEVPEFNLRELMPDGYGVDYNNKISSVKAGVDHKVTGDLLASLGVVLKVNQKISKGYISELEVGYNANEDGAKFEVGKPSKEFSDFNPDGSVSPYPLVQQAWDAHGKTALTVMEFQALLNFENLWKGQPGV